MLAAFEVEEHPSKGALAMLASYASSMTSGVIGAASRAASFGPSLLSQGNKGHHPYMLCRELLCDVRQQCSHYSACKVCLLL